MNKLIDSPGVWILTDFKAAVATPLHPALSSQVKMPLQPATPASHSEKEMSNRPQSVSLNPLLISLWGRRQGSGCSAAQKPAAWPQAAGRAGGRRRPWGSLLGSKLRENNNHTHCHHCLHYT